MCLVAASWYCQQELCSRGETTPRWSGCSGLIQVGGVVAGCPDDCTVTAHYRPACSERECGIVGPAAKQEFNANGRKKREWDWGRTGADRLGLLGGELPSVRAGLRPICVFCGRSRASALSLACRAAAKTGPAARAPPMRASWCRWFSQPGRPGSVRGGAHVVERAQGRAVAGEEGAQEVVVGRSEAAIGRQSAAAPDLAGASGIYRGIILGIREQVARGIVEWCRWLHAAG